MGGVRSEEIEGLKAVQQYIQEVMTLATQLTVGKSYHTREKNTVKIVEARELLGLEGEPVMIYTGNFTATKDGSENLLLPPNNVCKYNPAGKWQARPGQEQPDKSCHDLI